MTNNRNDLRSWLRGLPVFPDTVPTFSTDDLPDDPSRLFLDWLAQAAEAGQLAPHAACLSTSTADAVPNARILILKDLDERGWQFATHRTSPKAQEFGNNPVAALTFFWPATARQVRVSGTVAALPAEESARDFLARPLGSRAATLVGRQSEPLAASEDYDAAITAVLGRLDAEPDSVDSDWTLYAVDPSRIEFWQASADREHTRVLYQKHGDTWETTLLWP